MAISEQKQEFVEILLKQEVLTFGDFVTKSGRNSPFFFNTGQVSTGSQVYAWAKHYALSLQSHFGGGPYKLFGPAYKGIPLVVATAIACSHLEMDDPAFTFDRKEAKTHGEGGWMVGHALSAGDEVIVLEDVLTGGTSLRHTFDRLSEAGVKLRGAIVGIDRQEKGLGSLSASKELEQKYGVPIHSLISLREVVEVLHNKECMGKIWIDDTRFQAMEAYRSQYGVENS